MGLRHLILTCHHLSLWQEVAGQEDEEDDDVDDVGEEDAGSTGVGQHRESYRQSVSTITVKIVDAETGNQVLTADVKPNTRLRMIMKKINDEGMCRAGPYL